MKKRFAEEQIITILRETEAGAMPIRTQRTSAQSSECNLSSRGFR